MSVSRQLRFRLPILFGLLLAILLVLGSPAPVDAISPGSARPRPARAEPRPGANDGSSLPIRALELLRSWLIRLDPPAAASAADEEPPPEPCPPGSPPEVCSPEGGGGSGAGPSHDPDS